MIRLNSRAHVSRATRYDEVDAHLDRPHTPRRMLPEVVRVARQLDDRDRHRPLRDRLGPRCTHEALTPGRLVASGELVSVCPDCGATLRLQVA